MFAYRTEADCGKNAKGKKSTAGGRSALLVWLRDYALTVIKPASLGSTACSNFEIAPSHQRERNQIAKKNSKLYLIRFTRALTLLDE